MLGFFPKRPEVAHDEHTAFVVIENVLDGCAARLLVTLTEEHDALCHSDGSTCEDGCDAAPLEAVGMGTHRIPMRAGLSLSVFFERHQAAEVAARLRELANLVEDAVRR